MCGCNSTSASTSGTASSMSSFSASANSGYIVYRADGSTKEVSTEAEARMAVSASGGSYRKK